MGKTYIAQSGISLNVKLKSGKHAHVCFDMQSNGTSVYVTSNKTIIEALEADKRYGEWYKEMELPKVARMAEEEKHEAKEIEVTCLADAKEYLAMEHGVPRSSMRTKTAILLAAKANDVVFIGNLE